MALATYRRYNVRELVNRKWEIHFTSKNLLKAQMEFNRLVEDGRLFELQKVQTQYSDLHQTWDGKKIEIEDEE